MGGFHLSQEQTDNEYGEPRYPLDYIGVERLCRQEESQLQLPPEVDIEDKSKSDWLAKGLVIMRTLWFVIQCIARGHAQLPLTNLEIVTLAYTVMSFGCTWCGGTNPTMSPGPYAFFRFHL